MTRPINRIPNFYHTLKPKLIFKFHFFLSFTGAKMTVNTNILNQRMHRKIPYNHRIPTKRHPGKLSGKLHTVSRLSPGKLSSGKRLPPRPIPTSCDNSNDSGLGFDHHLENLQHTSNGNATRSVSAIR